MRLNALIAIVLFVCGITSSIAAENCDQAGVCFSDAQQSQYQQAMNLMKTQRWQEADAILANLYLEAPHSMPLVNNYAVVLAKRNKKAEAALILERYLLEHREVGITVGNLLKAYENLALTGTEAANLGLTLNLVDTDYDTSSPRQERTQGASNALTQQPLVEDPEQVLRNVSSQLQDFAGVWSKGDIDRYLDFYWPNISPNPTLNAEQWQQQRRQRVKPHRNIHVRIELLDTYFANDGTIITEFLQHYQANNYQDTAVKTMAWKQNGAAWKIVSERSQ